VETSAAARLSEMIRTAMKDQALSATEFADRVERLTGVRPYSMQVSRWLNGLHRDRPLVTVSPHLRPIALALGLDPLEMACDALRAELGITATPIDCTHPTSTEPDRPGQRCSKCCDTCNNDGHSCLGCGTPVGHLTRYCPDCTAPDDE